MSHITTVSLEIKDLDCLELAAKELGLELVRDVTTYKWFGQYMGDYDDPAVKAMGINPKDLGKCEHKLRVIGAPPGTYEIGLVKVDGSYRVLYDFYAGGAGLMEKISSKGYRGTDCDKLKQAYAVEVAKKELRRQGRRFSEVRENGTVRLVARA